MDPAKVRIILAISGALIGSAGIASMTVGVALFLAQFMPMMAAASLSGLALAAAGTLMVSRAFKVEKPSEAELDQLEEATAGALADLPFDTLKSMVEKRPLAVTGLAALVGYSMADDPGAAGKTLQRTLFGII